MEPREVNRGLPSRMVLMGVSGTGKTTVGEALAPRLGAVYLDGDDLHPAANIAKMGRGEALTDADRWPWLDRVGAALAAPRDRPVILGCSALKRAYRDRIRAAAGTVTFIHLAADYAVIEDRMEHRTGHFMPAGLLRSQFDTLEPPVGDEDAVTVDVAQPVAAIVDELAAALR